MHFYFFSSISTFCMHTRQFFELNLNDFRSISDHSQLEKRKCCRRSMKIGGTLKHEVRPFHIVTIRWHWIVSALKDSNRRTEVERKWSVHSLDRHILQHPMVAEPRYTDFDIEFALKKKQMRVFYFVQRVCHVTGMAFCMLNWIWICANLWRNNADLINLNAGQNILTTFAVLLMHHMNRKLFDPMVASNDVLRVLLVNKKNEMA